MSSLLELTGGEAMFAVSVLLVAAYIRGYSGFGFSAVLVAGMAFVIEPVAAVPLAITFEVLASVVQGRSVRSEIRWRDFRLLLAAAIIGNPIGVVILTTVEADVLRGATFVVLFVLSGTLLLGRSANVTPTTGVIFAVGVIAGIVNGATAMSGLVLVLAMSYIAITPAAMRATLIAYFFASDLVVLAVLLVRDELDDTLFWRALIGIPVLVIGVAVGSRSFRRTSDATFRRVTLGLLASISIVGLVTLAT